ncbi:MAG: biotin transporter BioY [Clostridia bacterium]|nr:biotin transporter BioY [Clostridia bacterium]
MKEKTVTEPSEPATARTEKKKVASSAAREVAYIALGIALITVCAWISIPLGPIPVTLQTFAVPFLGAVLGWKRGLASVVIYFLMGLVGIPVFAGFRAGVAVLFGPTGGYLLGFLVDVILVGVAKLLRLKNRWVRIGVLYGAMILGAVFYFSFGTLWFMTMYKGAGGISLAAALMMCVVPYLAPDAVKAALAALLAVRLERFVK